MMKCQKVYRSGATCDQELNPLFNFCPRCGTAIPGYSQLLDDNGNDPITTEKTYENNGTKDSAIKMHEDPGGGDEEVSNVKKVSESKEYQLLQAEKTIKEKTKEDVKKVQTESQQGNANCSSLDKTSLAKEGSSVDKSVDTGVLLQTQESDIEKTDHLEKKVMLRSDERIEISPESQVMKSAKCEIVEERSKESVYIRKDNISPKSDMKYPVSPEDCKMQNEKEKSLNKHEEGKNAKEDNIKQTQSENVTNQNRIDNGKRSKDMSSTEHTDRNEKDKLLKDIQNQEKIDNADSQIESIKTTKEWKAPVVKITFHAFLSPNVILDLEKDSIVVVFSGPLDNWTKKHILTPCDAKSINQPIRFKVEVEIEKDLLKEPIPYVYNFIQRKKDGCSMEPEFFLHKYPPYGNRCRHLTVPKRGIDQGTWNQYDGCIYATKGGMFFNVKEKITGGFQQVMLQDGKSILKKYLESAITLPEDNAELVKMMGTVTDIVSGGIKDHFLKNRHNPDAILFKKAIWEHVSTVIGRLTCETKGDVRQVWVSVLIVNAIIEIDIPLDVIGSSTVRTLLDCLVLNSDIENQSCEQLMYIEQCASSEERRKVRTSLVKFLQKSLLHGKKVDPSWLAIMPLVHYLEGSLKPFAPLDLSTFEPSEAKEEKWWCFSDFKNAKDEMKRREWTLPCVQFLEKYKTLFRVDASLQKTFMAALNLSTVVEVMDFTEIQLEIKMATILHYIQHSSRTDQLLLCMSHVYKILLQSLNSLPKDTPQRQMNEIEVKYKNWFQQLIGIIHDGMRRFNSYWNLVLTCFHCALLSYAILDRVSHVCEELESDVCLITTLLDDFLQHKTVDLECAEYALSIEPEFPCDRLPANFAGKILSAVEKFLKTIDVRTVVDIYASGTTNFTSSSLLSLLERQAFSSMEEIVQDKDFYGLFTMFEDRTRNNIYIPKLLGNFFQRIWKTDLNAPTSIYIQQILTCNCYPQYIASYFNSGVLMDYMDEDSKKQLKKSIQVLEELFSALEENKIKIDDLLIVLKYSENLTNIADQIQKIPQFRMPLTPDTLAVILECRTKDMKTLKDAITIVESLDEILKQVRYYKSGLPNGYKEVLENWRKMTLEDICDIPAQMPDCLMYIPALKVFSEVLKEPVKGFVTGISFYKQSKTFRTVLDKERQSKTKMQVQGYSFMEVLTNILIPSQARWDGYCNKLVDGSITIEDIVTLRLDKVNDNELTKEFTAMNRGSKKPWIENRIAEFRRFKCFTQSVEIAKLLKEIQVANDIGGNFQFVELIRRSEKDKDISLIELASEAQSFNQKLRNVDTIKKDCLKAFCDSSDMIKWLRSSLSGGVKDLKIYADLALMSVEEDDLIAHVTNLHTATIGYAPLIYDVCNIQGEDELIERCEDVWTSLEKDPNLPRKLRESNRLLDWFKEIKEAHGSVEVTSLNQVDAIRQRGIFKVRRLRSDQRRQDQDQLNLENILCLCVPSSDPKNTTTVKDNFAEEWNEDLDDLTDDHIYDEEVIQIERKIPRDPLINIREYSYGDMMDLQSRLMLVSGKTDSGRESIERFTAIFDNITRLGRIFVKLYDSGCVLFKDWSFEFLCNPTVENCVFVKYSASGQTPLKGENFALKNKSLSQDDVINDYMKEIGDFFEKCSEDWLDHLRKTRDKFYPLNFFTTAQIIILQEEIAKYRNGIDVSSELFPLLSTVKAGCSKSNLDFALQKLEESLNIEANHDEPEMALPTKESFELNFLAEADKAGISREKALKCIAVGMFDPDDLEKSLIWCYEQDENEEENIETLESPSKPENQPEQLSVSSYHDFNQKIDDIIRQEAIDNIGTSLAVIWKHYLEFSSLSKSDFLSLEHLGIVLKSLYESDDVIVRPLPVTLKAGSPNLITCPQDEVLHMFFTLFMENQSLPLPNRNEVLLCTENTSTEEITLFFRRALRQEKEDSNQRIYCLLNADLLRYDVCDESLKTLMENMRSAKTEYRLVVICSSENEYQSPIISALEKFRTPKIAVSPKEKIQKYIEKKFCTTEKTDGNTASVLDNSRLCVRVVKSERAGLGKTLYKIRLDEKLQQLYSHLEEEFTQFSFTIPLSREQNANDVSRKFIECTSTGTLEIPRIIHIDVATKIDNVAPLLFNLLILGSIVDDRGHVFQRSITDLYLIEMTISESAPTTQCTVFGVQLMNVLPSVECISPKEELEGMETNPYVLGFDDHMFDSEVFQRPFQYLKCLELDKKTIPVFNRFHRSGDKQSCLQILMRHCCVEDPSWAELKNFVYFLNTQLEDFEKSSFCSAALASDLPGFSKFVLRFLIQMSKDFSTRSLMMTKNETEDTDPGALHGNQSNDQNNEEIDVIDLSQYQIRRRWESSAHPYLFFNPDHHTLTFIGFNIDKQTRNLVDRQTNRILERNIMTPVLWNALVANRVPLQENFDDLIRSEKIERLCRVIGNEFPHDPDVTYELTTDNVKKMMAIYMRFRCNIPVIVMGETGCGKTRLIKFLCALQSPPGVSITNMVIMKVHGGTTKKHIISRVVDAERIAKENCERHGNHIITVLFFDEANTTEAIGCIKEIMCDGTIDGRPINLNSNLKLVAACNPYRKHSDEMIARLEQAGLGYHVNVEETKDKLGRIPMRHLVYRVEPLPQSMIPLVWDFGQLDSTVERLYILQMLTRYIHIGKIPRTIQNAREVLANILTASQNYMRGLKDECSFVSLRDVERTLSVFGWFYHQDNIFEKMDQLTNSEILDSDIESDDDDEEETVYVGGEWATKAIEKTTRAIILALGVCYQASLKDRKKYRRYIAKYFTHPLYLQNGPEQIQNEITRCQRVFLENVNLNEKVAKNLALRENFFMMVVCVQLRIPLFLVGKPGSSKSLSKSILDHNMQGRESHSDLFKTLKQVQIISFQCSPLATAEGIMKTFQQASRLQENKDLERFASVVVLDEVGLAEDSPKMPLKALHPLLEDGCLDNDEFEEHKKVAFIGISNWALDPAKMNRGILVQREVPDEKELIETAKEICSSDEDLYSKLEDIIPNLAKGYLHVFRKAISTSELFGPSSIDQLKAREFFGLRDFYSLIKMISGIVSQTNDFPTPSEIAYAIRRNFGGLQGLDPVQEFAEYVPEMEGYQNDEDENASGFALLRECLEQKNDDRESRYVLLLTENYSTLNLLEQLLTNNEDTQILFGSSFPKDQEYIEICRNINRIKVFMETGKTVVLLNLENLYESLYDALNQYYMESGTDRFIDLGLGTHRVKCKVDRNFRLIVVAEKRVVYKEFPIPLINRLEKHFLTMEGCLTPIQLQLLEDLNKWVQQFSTYSGKSISPAEIFLGYNEDSCPGVILSAWEISAEKRNAAAEDVTFMENVLQTAKDILLWSCTPDAILRLLSTTLSPNQTEYTQRYFEHQCHDDLIGFLKHRKNSESLKGRFFQVTTHSKLLSEEDKEDIENNIPELREKIAMFSLQAFGTEQQFSRQIRKAAGKGFECLFIQCDTGEENVNLVACARHSVLREISMAENICVIFIVHLSRVCKVYFNGFQTGVWKSVHIDDLRKSQLPAVSKLLTMTLPKLLEESLNTDPSEDRETGHLDIRKLLLDSLHPALASISEEVDSEQSSLDRIRIVFNILEKEETLTNGQFGYGVVKLLSDILIKKEEENSPLNAPSIGHKASKLQNINKCGTLRSSCCKVIERTVTPVLANILSFLDTNSNMGILDRAPEKSWEHALWMKLLYVIEPEHVTIYAAPEVKCTGQNSEMKGKFPFSWILFENIEKILKSCSENIIGKSAEDLMSQTPLAVVINKAMDGRDPLQAMQFYMSDFVNMKCNVTSTEQEQLICECIVTNMNASYAQPDLLSSQLISIHRVFSELKEAIQIFIDIAALEEEDDDTRKLFESVQARCEMLDVESVKYLIRKLDPSDALETLNGQRQWLQMLQRYKPYIAKVLQPMSCIDSPNNPKERTLIPLRSSWSKIVALKLYIENVAGDDNKEKLVTQGCKFLWRFLGDNADFKKVETVEKFEKFLKSSNKKAMKDFLEKFGKCNHCQKLFESSPPLILPCGHMICRENCQMLIDYENDGGKCPECMLEFSEDEFNLQTHEPEKDQLKMFWDYQKKCNRFYMQVVAQLCFENSTAPTEEVCEKLLQLVIFRKKIPELDMTLIRTRQMGIFESIVDASPVFRSFLLQLMIRSNKDAVLQIFLEATSGTLNDESEMHIRNLYLLVIQCIEDLLLEELAVKEFSFETENELEFARNLIQQATKQFQEEQATTNKIKSIARARFGLQLTAKYLHYRLSAQQDLTDFQTSLCDDLFQCAASLCDLPIDHIRLYLLKYVCRHYGLELYRDIQSSTESWVIPQESAASLTNDGQENICPDYCLILGEQYRHIKEQIRDFLVTTDKSKKIKVNDRSLSGQVLFLLSLCKAMKSLELFEADYDEKEQIKAKMKKALGKQKVQFVKENLDMVIDNSFGQECHQFEFSFWRSMQDEGIIFLIFHLMYVLKAQGKKGLLKPLDILARDPASMKNGFLPTMPEEGLTNEIKIELQKMEELANRHHHKFTWYRCPNGHLYGVGDCGNPTQKSQCYECHAEIGSEIEGQIPNSTKYSGDDHSRPGHILGSPGERSLDAVSERKLSPIANALLRLLTHIAMFIGANDFIEEITALLRPQIPNAQVPEFLWEHILVDISTLRKAFDQSLDGLFMFLHVVIHSLLENPLTEYGPPFQDISSHIWETKDGRRLWENEFSKHCFSSVLQSRNAFFNTCEEILSSDSGIESDPTLRRVFNLDQPIDDPFVLESPESCGSLWNHRLKVSFEHFVQEFHIMRERQDPFDNTYLVLDTFLRQDSILRYLRCIPLIVSMQTALKHRYGKKITKEEANSITIKECILQCKNEVFSERIEKGVSSLCELWRCFRKFYETFDVPDANTNLRTLLERDIDIDVDCLSLLIPDSQGLGLTVGLVVRFMVGKQNDFIKQFEELMQTRSTKLRDLRFEDLTPNELISYHHESDLLPIIISNCNYTYSKNDCATLEYDFDSIQAAITDQIIQGKPIINVDVLQSHKISVYRADASITEKLTALSRRIPQVQLNSVKQRKIISEFSDLPEIYKGLERLDTVMNFLLSVKCSGEELLSTFMTKVLQMPLFQNQEVCASCKVHHVQSLWFTMIFEKTKKLTDSEKDGFESMTENILEPLTEQSHSELRWYFSDLSSEKLNVLLQQLLEFIIFTLDQGQGDAVSYTYSLKESLLIHLETPLYADADISPLTLDDINHLPENVLSSHAVQVWKMICNTLHIREQ
ncbi:E3 ubiquitin-protein ligase rnf213-alpha-like isoform X2 [Crassostrea virginica]